MKNLLKNKTVLIVMSLIFALLAFVSAFVVRGVASAEFSVGKFEDSYYVGDVIYVPDATFSIGGQEVPAEFEIICPDGDKFTNDGLTLTQYGNYTVRYYVKNTSYSRSVSFKVEKLLYEISGKGSAEFGYHPYLDEYDEGTGITTQHGGIITSITQGSKFVLNKVIDLSKLSPTDPIITLNITPTEKGYLDFERINMRLTDVHDPSKFIIMITKDQEWTDGDYLSYSLCNINDENVYYRGSSEYSSGTLAGMEALFSFRGTPGYDPDNPDAYKEFRNYANDTISWYIDYAEQDLYIIGANKAQKKLVCNLDATGAWDSFTTGEVKLEIYGDTYTNTYANFVIREIGGCNLSDKNLVDEQAPQITVDYGEYDKEIPKGLVDKNYKIFDASAYDIVDGFVDVKTLVYKNYYTNNRIAVNVEDGYFKPTEKGVYTICYTATDNFDNVAVEVVDVEITDEQNPIVFEIGERVTEGKQNVAIPIAEYSVEGGFGNKKVEINVTFEDENVTVKGGQFVPMKVGTYTVTYLVSDYVGQVVTENNYYEVDVELNTEPSVSGSFENEFERFYIKGFSYEVPQVQMYVFNQDGKTYTTQTANVTVENGTITNGVYVPSTEGFVTFTYKLDSSKGEGYKVTRPVHSINDTREGYETLLDMKKMFVLDEGVTAGYGADKPGYAYYQASRDSSIKFVNSLFAESFSIMLYNDKEMSNLTGIDITLTDSLNPEQQVVINLIKAGSKTSLNVNGKGKPTEINTQFKGEQYSVSLVGSSGKLTVSGTSASIKEYVSGEKYQGFSSNLIYLDLTFKGVGEGGCRVFVKEVCAHSLIKTGYADSAAPLITYLGNIAKIAEKDSVYVLPEVVSSDVVSPALKSFTLTVKNPDGSYAVSDNVTLNNVPVQRYSINLGAYGEYIITYTAIDYSGNSATRDISVMVCDFVAPTIELTGNKILSAKVGNMVNVCKATYKDNYGTINEDIGFYVMVKKPTGKIIVLDSGKYNFMADISGEYVVYYYVLDRSEDGVSQGNVAIESYSIVVS